MWYYLGPGNQQQGPVDEAQFRQLVAAGTITGATLVWQEGLAEWKPYASLEPAPSAASAYSESAATCQICGQAVGADNLIELAGIRTCAACKPKALQAITEGGQLAVAAVWRSGKRVVAHDGALFPARCVKCNQPAVAPPLKRKLFWHHPAWYLFLFIHFIIYIIVAIIVRKRATVDIFLCQQHLDRRKNYLIAVWVCLGLSLLSLILAIALSEGWIALFIIVFLLAALILGMGFARPLATTKIKDKTAWLGGAGKEFLDSLPTWNG